MQPLISVVMPSLNQAAFIELAIRSVLEQDYPELELVVVDGGSSDKTPAILERLAGEFGSRLRWWSEPDSGPASAVNKAVTKVRGEIVGWLNSDDLYMPGAIRAAVDILQANPSVVMVYGQAEHIDAAGWKIGEYPSLRPDGPIERFQKGCFICQPTVFLRKEALLSIGPLNEGLATAFDFDFWLRVFLDFPGRIGFVDRLQAQSRLHDSCITRRMRRKVTEEGVRVLARHLGYARPEWVLSYLDEVCQIYPSIDAPEDLRADLSDLVGSLQGCFSMQDAAMLSQTLEMDMRLRLATPSAFVTVYPDGWAPAQLDVRLRLATQAWSWRQVHRMAQVLGVRQRPRLIISCENSSPACMPLRLNIHCNWGGRFSQVVQRSEAFCIEVPLDNDGFQGKLHIAIESSETFIPAMYDPSSEDRRELAFRVTNMDIF